ncbi:MAG TPA: hypothetical protein VLJ76_05175 [Gaiellaceae bacterium]|nr:hypothetical protein [Gaiellaceae bacterium]
MLKFFTGLALVIGLAVTAAAGSAAAAGPANVTCHSGDILEGTYHNVTVAKGNFCFLLDATVTGNVQANNALQIGIDSSTIGGNVQANNVTGNGWLCGSTVGGNVEVGNNTANADASPGTWFIGDASWCIPSFDPVPGNYVGGNLQFHNNTTGGSISNNDIEGNLQCQNNTPAPTGSNNAVDGDTQGQCAGLAGGVDDSASPPDSD